MPAPSGNSLLAALAMLAAPAQARPLSFETAFAASAAPRASHAVVLYRGADGEHRLELWREGETRVRRDTDGRLTTVAAHRAGDPAYRLDLFDHARRIHTVVDRDSLYRVGRFTDWQDLAHGLRHPVGRYSVREVAGVKSSLTPAAPCRWYALATPPRRSLICWSAAETLPMLILGTDGQPVWRVTAFDHHPAPPAIFRPSAPGYVLNNARAEISGD